MENNFLRTFAKLSERTEIPGIFSVWSGLAVLSCILGRRVWIDMGVYTIYPNLYICLVASSGKCRKSTSISIAEKLLHQIEPNPNLISQKITPEALIEALKVIQTNDAKVFLRESCVGFVIADELATFLNRRTFEAGLSTVLIPLYDCKPHFSYHTRGRGKEILTNSCLGMLSGTTIDKLKEAVPKESVGEGLTSRIIFVYCASVANPVAITQRTKEQGETEVELIKFLQKAYLLEGKIELSKEAWELYENNYNQFYTKSPLYNLPTLAGYASRRHVHLMKLAILFAVSNRLSLVIEESDLESADKILILSEKAMPMLMNIVTSSEDGLLMEEIYGYIKEAKAINKKTLLAKVAHKLDSHRFETIYRTLVESGRVQVEVRGSEFLFVAT